MRARVYLIRNYYEKRLKYSIATVFFQHILFLTYFEIITTKPGRAWGTGSVYLNTGCSHEVTGGFPILSCIKTDPRRGPPLVRIRPSQ